MDLVAHSFGENNVLDEGRGERERTSTNQEEKEIYGFVIYELWRKDIIGYIKEK